MSTSSPSCLYEVLGLTRDCTPDEIRSAYKKLALQRHPDKLLKSGVSESDATAQFQELVNAYEVLSDTRERAWYDSHRSQILYSSSSGSDNVSASVPDLFAFFSNSAYNGYGSEGKGFYKVYGDVFDGVFKNEVVFAKRLGLAMPKEAPLMGNLDSPYTQVTAFYSYWIGFVTMMDFCWVDQYDAMAGMNRKSRRVMEDENKKLRKKARREFNDTVRGLAEFVKKRDKRVIDMQVKRAEESEKKRVVEMERKKELERLKAEKARMYEEPDWAKVEEEEEECLFDESLEEEEHKEEELYCVACGKKFKSDKQWKNHEQSKKHKEKVAELRKAFSDEDKTVMDSEDVEGDASGYLSADTDVSELMDQFEESVAFEEEKHDDDDDDDEAQSSDESGFVDAAEVNGSEGNGIKLESDDEDASILEAMLSGRKGRKTDIKSQPKTSEEVKADVDSDEMDFMNYNKTKGTRRNKGGKKRRARKPDEEAGQVNRPETSDQAEEKNEPRVEESTSCSLSENESDVKGDDQSETNHKLPKQFADKKTEKEHTKPKKAIKGGKQATATKKSGNVCEKCGEEFASKTKLHKHLGETGHATLKYG